MLPSRGNGRGDKLTAPVCDLGYVTFWGRDRS